MIFRWRGRGFEKNCRKLGGGRGTCPFASHYEKPCCTGIKWMIPKFQYQRQDAIYFDVYLHAKNLLHFSFFLHIFFLHTYLPTCYLSGYFGHSWPCPSANFFLLIFQTYCKPVILGTLSMPSQTHLKNSINLQQTLMFISLPKICSISIIFWYLTLKESCNLIGQKHFVLYLRKPIFSRHGIYAGKQKINFPFCPNPEKTIFL